MFSAKKKEKKVLTLSFSIKFKYITALTNKVLNCNFFFFFFGIVKFNTTLFAIIYFFKKTKINSI